MFERLTADKVYLNSIRFGIQVNFPPHCGHEKAKEVDDFVKNVFDRLAAYEDSGLSPEEVQGLAKSKAEGRITSVKCPCDASEEAERDYEYEDYGFGHDFSYPIIYGADWRDRNEP